VLYGDALRRAARTPYPLASVTVAPLVTLWFLCQLFGLLPHALHTFPVDSYLEFVAPALAVASGVPFAIWCGMAVGRDADTRVLDQVLSTPVPRLYIAMATLLAAATAAACSALLVSTVALAAGATIASGFRGLLGVVGLAAALGVIYAGMAWIITALIPGRRVAGAILGALLLCTLLGSDLLLPNGLLPLWLRLLANANPLTVAIDGARAVTWDHVDWGRWERGLLVLLAPAIAAAIGAAVLPRPLRAGP